MDKRGLSPLIIIIILVIAVGVISTFYFLGYGEDEITNDVNETNNESYTPPPQLNETHTICSNNTCITTDGAGEDECSSDTDCETDEGLPDLIINNLTMAVTDTETNTTTNVSIFSVTVYITVKNIGKAGIEQSVTRVSFRGEDFPLSSANMFTSALEPDQEITLESTYDDLGKGKYYASALADELLKIDEIDEENNGFTTIDLFVDLND